LIQKVASAPVGQSAVILLLRDVDGKLEKRTVNVVLGERPITPTLRDTGDSVKPTKEQDPKGNALHLGITLGELTAQVMTEKHLTGVRGLYIKDIDPNGLVAEVRTQAGQPALSEGDVITHINRIPVSSLADFERILGGLKPGDPIVLHVASYRRNADRLAQSIVQFTYQ
jgi:hypothetical protein